MAMTLRAKAADNLTQLIEAKLQGTDIKRPTHDVRLPISIVAIRDKAFRICDGSEGRELSRVHGTAYALLCRAWDSAYKGSESKPKEDFTPPPMKRGK